MRAPLIALSCLVALPASAEFELSVYLGTQSAPHSRIEGENANGEFDQLIEWEGKPFEAPPYYGIRAMWWTSDTLGFGVELNHTKVYGDEDDLRDAGFETLELTDGLNIITANVFRRFPDAWGPFTPYIGGGLGVAVPHVDAEDGENDTFEYQLTGPAAMVLAGVSYDINETWGVFGEYKATYSSNEADLDGGGTLETDIVTNALNFGISYSF
ncbi:outer membrane protein [Aestuariibius sp. 2305UL40-4]|uniref:outer membrane protein n=1 Tax=Aestuariibius violaceus TaxID=3234132 RepID=UPI00345E8F17